MGSSIHRRRCLRVPRDAPLEVRDALAIRGDAVRRRGRDSRRVTRSSSTSPRARSISEVAAQTRGAALATQCDPSRAPRDAVDGIRDAQRGADDAHGEAQKPAPTSTSLSGSRWKSSRPSRTSVVKRSPLGPGPSRTGAHAPAPSVGARARPVAKNGCERACPQMRRHPAEASLLAAKSLRFVAHFGNTRYATPEMQKFSTMTARDEWTTARVVAHPTPSDPPKVESPLAALTMGMAAP
jgi:hypothetical protein